MCTKAPNSSFLRRTGAILGVRRFLVGELRYVDLALGADDARQAPRTQYLPSFVMLVRLSHVFLCERAGSDVACQCTDEG